MYNIGIDLGGTNIAAGLVDRDLHLVCQVSRPTGLPKTPERLADDIHDLALELLGQNGLTEADVGCAGIGIPGTVNQAEGTVEYANNFGFDNVPFVRLLRQRFACTLLAANDAGAAAWGEYLAGCGKGTRSMVAVTLGTGVGGGIILNGRLWEGCNAAAGELGHMVIHTGGRPCTCGRRGCLEAYASATALIRRAEESLAEAPESALARGPIDGRAVFAAAQAGDETAARVLDAFVEDLAEGVANVINLLQPELLCIGGGLSGAGDQLLEPLRRKVAPLIYSRYSRRNTRLELASLDNAAGIIGAAGLDRQEELS